MKPCPYCQGEGHVTMQWGAGYHVTPSGQKIYVSSGASQPVWTEETCPECKGAGEVEEEDE